MRLRSALRIVAPVLLFLTMMAAPTAQAGQATLSWSPPTTYTDRSPFTAIAGYKVHIGTTSCSYQQHIDVGNATSYTAQNLTDGTAYYFAITAYDTSGAESPYSREVYKILPPIVTHTITATAGTGGSIIAEGNSNVTTQVVNNTTIIKITVNDGADQLCTISSKPGYVVSDVSVDGSSVGAPYSYTFSNVKTDHTLGATFAAENFTIVATAGTGGSITPSGSTTLPAGSNQMYSIVAATGFSIAEVKVDGVSKGAVTTYSFSNLTANHTIEATFASAGYTITAAAGPGGSITPSGSATVNSGSSQTYTITPATGYSVSDVKVDGVSVGAVTSYAFTDVNTNHTIEAAFSIINYTITASAGSGGSITPTGATTVSHGGTQTFAIAAVAGYGIADVMVDGASVGAVTSYTFDNVTANHSIEATFSLSPHTITAKAGAGGTITPSGAISVSSGGNQTFTIAPSPGRSIADVRVDGASVGTVTAYTFNNVTANHTIEASFGITTYTITASAGTGGSITPAGNSTVSYGASQSYSISAAAGYRITDVRVDNVSVGPVTTYTFTSVAADHTIQATFGANVLFAVNSGGPLYSSSSGLTYLADTNFTGGSAVTTTATISGTSDGGLYQSSRQGSSFSYRIPLANGSYSVTFKFAETQYTAARRRSFNVAIGGTTVISNLDIYAKVGANAAYDVTVPATVTNGTLTISFTKKNANATVSAITVTVPGAAQGPASGKLDVAANATEPPLPAEAMSDAAFALLWQRVIDRGLEPPVQAMSSYTPPAPSTKVTSAPAQQVQPQLKTALTTAAESIYAPPADRIITWAGNVGVLGDIPNRTTVCATLAPSGGDDTTAIQSAIDGCGTDQVVALQSGTFTISRAITVKSNVTLRGAGMGSTIIRGAAGMGGVYLIGFNATPAEGASVATLDLAKGSTTITTTTPHGWKAGDLLLIDQLNNPAGDPVVTNAGYAGTCYWCGRASGSRCLGQVSKVVDVPDATTATLEVPLYWNYLGNLAPQATKFSGITSRAGVEDMTVDNSASASKTQANDGATLVMYGASNCWFLRVEAVGAYETTMRIKRGYRNTIRSCRLHEGTPALPPDGSSYDTSRAYGIWVNPGSANLIENNLMYHLAMPMVMNSTASGNVVGYNYITDLYYVNMNWNIAAIGFHGGHPFMNLVEGNYGEGRLQPDFVWGSSSHNTFFRNRMSLVSAKGGAKWDVDLAKGSQYYNVIGNVLGTRGFETVYMFENAKLTSAPAIYRMGYVSDGDNDAAGNDPQVAATALLQGNWDSVNNGTIWNGIAAQGLPASMYLTGKPSWWGTMPWPAIGPDVSPMYPAAPGMCNGMPWADKSLPSPAIPSAPGSVTVQ